MNIDYSLLIEKALDARKRSYCPYSGIAVGAALMTNDGKIYTGANIEAAAYSPTVCAERVAFFHAVHEGEREFAAIAVVGAKADEEPSYEFPPCGVCRQVMTEFCRGDFEIVLFDGEKTSVYTLDEILPLRFGKELI